MTKLNNRQLKKLYDYGGTLSPKDWANMIDSLDNSVVDTDSLPIIKTTYEEVVNLYRKEMLNPNVKYEFDYDYSNPYDSMDAFFENLRIYINGKDVKVEYTAPSYASELELRTYPISFVAKFKFDSILTDDNMYECKRNYDVYINVYSESNINLLFNTLDEYSIDYKVVSNSFDPEANEGFIELFIKNSVVNYIDGYYQIYTLDKCITINENSGDTNTYNHNATILAAITDVQYPNGTFHNIFIDRCDNNYGFGYLSLLEHMQLYNAPLDTFIESYHVSDLESHPIIDIISFGDVYVLNVLAEKAMMDEVIEDKLVISNTQGIYIIDKLNTDY